eukprot:6239038-Pyramimonas_sp.AAC.1
MSAHPSQASRLQGEPPLMPPVGKFAWQRRPMSAHPSHVSWPHMELHLRNPVGCQYKSPSGVPVWTCSSGPGSPCIICPSSVPQRGGEAYEPPTGVPILIKLKPPCTLEGTFWSTYWKALSQTIGSTLCVSLVPR